MGTPLRRRHAFALAPALIIGPLVASGAQAQPAWRFPAPPRGPVVDVGAAPVVVVGVAGQPRNAVRGGAAFTLVPFHVEQRVSGGAPADLVVRTRGGRLPNGVVQVTEHQPRFRPGRRSRLFLRRVDGVYEVVGDAQGKQDAPNATAAPRASSQCDAGQTQGDGYCLEGQSWSQSSFPVHYKVNANTPDVSGEETAVQAALQTWENDAGSYADFTYDGSTTTASSSCGNPSNSVYWKATANNYIGLTTWCYSGGTMVHFDIEMNDSYTWALGASQGTVDVQSVVTHEAGHSLGLGHNNVDSTQVMYPTLTMGTTKRSLGRGDVNGVRALYPSGGTPSPTPSPSPGTSGVAVADYSFTPSSVNTTLGGAVLWTFDGPSAHTATDLTGLGLFDSGSRGPGTTYSFDFVAAGTYRYDCTLHPITMTGKVKVPMMVAPSSGTAATAFTITWASGAPPGGDVFDVQVRKPRTTSWTWWQSGVTTSSASFQSSKSGTWSFRARLRNPSTGKASRWSPAVSISIQ